MLLSGRIRILWHGDGIETCVNYRSLMMIGQNEMPRPSNRGLRNTVNNARYDTLKHIQSELHRIAPSPGALVLVNTQTIPRPHSTFDSLILSAMDACTHLQLARFYFVSSLAATIDFLEFAVNTFPFPITELRTDHTRLFSSDTARQVEHRFTLAAHRIGIRHSIRDLQGDTVESNLRQYFFEAALNRGTQEDDEAILADVQKYLFFHNNHRSLPTLEGKTPVDKLRSFGTHRRMKTFDPA